MEPRANSQGMVGQAKARKTAGMILKIVHEGRITGRAMSFAEPPSTGKIVLNWVRLWNLVSSATHVVLNMRHRYGAGASSQLMSKMEAFRRCICIHIKEDTEPIEGEVVEIQIDRGF